MKLEKWVVATILAGAVCIPQLVAAERTGSHSVRASTLKGATITFQEGGAAGRVEDIILDPETGCARFAVIQLEGGRTVAAPYRVLHSSGPSGYVVAVTRDQLLNAPAVDLNRVEEFSAPEFSQRVYGYYRMGPEGEVNVRGVQGKIRVEGEQGRESEAQRAKHGQEQVAPGAAESRRSPAPLGERTKKKNHGQASVTPSPSASVTPAAMPSASPSTTVIPTPTVSPNAPAREEATPAVKETPATTPAGSRPQTPAAPKVTPGAQ